MFRIALKEVIVGEMYWVCPGSVIELRSDGVFFQKNPNMPEYSVFIPSTGDSSLYKDFRNIPADICGSYAEAIERGKASWGNFETAERRRWDEERKKKNDEFDRKRGFLGAKKYVVTKAFDDGFTRVTPGEILVCADGRCFVFNYKSFFSLGVGVQVECDEMKKYKGFIEDRSDCGGLELCTEASVLEATYFLLQGQK